MGASGPVASSAQEEEARPAARRRPGRLGGHHLRAQEWHPLGNAPDQAVRSVGDDGLEAPGAVDAGRGVRATPARSTQRVGTEGLGGLQSRLDRLLVGPGFKRGALTGKNPTDRAKAGSKHHLLVDRKGLPLAEGLTGANVHDTHELFPLLDAVPDVKQPRGRPRHRPGKLHADKAYSSRKNRLGLRRRGITARIARPGIESKQRLGRHRWVVERTNAWINQLRRLRVRDERRDDVHFALLVLGCCLILFRGLQT